jgi:hypothetical protein
MASIRAVGRLALAQTLSAQWPREKSSSSVRCGRLLRASEIKCHAEFYWIRCGVLSSRESWWKRPQRGGLRHSPPTWSIAFCWRRHSTRSYTPTLLAAHHDIFWAGRGENWSWSYTKTSLRLLLTDVWIIRKVISRLTNDKWQVFATASYLLVPRMRKVVRPLILTMAQVIKHKIKSIFLNN